MNPFRYLAPTVQHILAYPKTSINSTICTHMIDEKLFKIIQEDLLSSFRSSAASIGEDKLGFKPKDVGTHSNRYAAVISMFMYNNPVYIIMLMGLWSSDTFLKSIRSQVL